MENADIILEGGAMRSMFSAGVLDSFLDNDIQIPNVIAVSAGAYAGMNYVSGQRGRVLEPVRDRSDRYNRSLETLKELERKGNVFVLRSGDEICLTNNKADAEKLREYYRHGYKTAEDKKEKIKNFLLNT